MIDKITNLVKQMSESEQLILYEYIKSQYCLEERKMLRDDIKEKVAELLMINMEWVEYIENEDDSFKEHLIDSSDVADFCRVLIEEFDLESIPLCKVIEWQKIKDIVDYIEDSLTPKEPYLPSFEIEA